MCVLSQESPTPGPTVRKWVTQQEVSGGQASEASSVFTVLPIAGITT